MNFTLTMKELHAIENALRVACDQYSTDAYAMDCANQPRVAEQFRAQRAEAQALLAKIEDGTGLSV